MLSKSSEEAAHNAASLKFMSCQSDAQGTPLCPSCPKVFYVNQSKHLESILFADDDMYYVARLSEVGWLLFEDILNLV